MYKVVSFLIYWQFFHVYFNRTEMLFCYWRLNYTFFSSVFQVSCRVYGIIGGNDIWLGKRDRFSFFPGPPLTNKPLLLEPAVTELSLYARHASSNLKKKNATATEQTEDILQSEEDSFSSNQLKSGGEERAFWDFRCQSAVSLWLISQCCELGWLGYQEGSGWLQLLN